MVEGGAGDRHPLLHIQQLVGREGDGEAIQQVVAHRPLLGVVGGDQQAAAGVGEAQPLALDPVVARPHRRKEQVGDLVVEQVEFIDVEHAPVGFGQQARLEHRRPGGQGGGYIHRAHQPVLGDAQRHLHKRGRLHPGGQQGGAVGTAGIAPQLGDAPAGGGIPVVRAAGIDVEGRGGAAQIEAVDRRQQGVEPPGEH